MKETRLIMGMPVIVEIVGAPQEALEPVFDYFTAVDERFSTYKPASEVSRINRGEIAPEAYSAEMREVLALSEQTRIDTDGYFNVRTPDGSFDPSGIVKGWAIRNAARLVRNAGYDQYWVEAGGDIQVAGRDAQGDVWTAGIRNPFNEKEIVKVLRLDDCGIATSGNYIRGEHIYDPHTGAAASSGLVSVTVVGPDVYEADRFATAAFAMGARGIHFIESLDGFQGYAIDANGQATMTTGLHHLVVPTLPTISL